MFDWISQNKDVLNVLIGFATLMVWGVYAQLLYNGYKRHDRAESKKGIVRLRSLTIQLVAIYGSDDYPIGVERRFLIRDLDEGRLLVPATWDSKRLTSRRHRKQVRQLIQDLAREEARN